MLYRALHNKCITVGGWRRTPLYPAVVRINWKLCVCNVHMCLSKWEAFMSLCNFAFCVCLLIFLKLFGKCPLLPKEIGPWYQALCMEFLLYSFISLNDIWYLAVFKTLSKTSQSLQEAVLNGTCCCYSSLTDEGTRSPWKWFSQYSSWGAWVVRDRSMLWT